MEKLGAAPLRRYRPAGYPTKLAVLARPGLLRRHLPKPWLAHREIAAVAGALLVVDATGCRRASDPGGSYPLSPTAAAVVAPIFKHGGGRVGTGCIAVTPPTLLSEDEALQIMREEFDRSGLAMTQQNVPLGTVIIAGLTPVSGYEWVRGYADHGWQETKAPLEVDLLDPERHIAVEFVSRADFYPLGGETDRLRFWSTAGDIDYAAVARSVSDQVRRQAQGVFFGAFYEPVVTDWRRFGTPAAAREREAELLRAQVQDFVDWLKAQGAI